MENQDQILDAGITVVETDPRDNKADRGKRFINMLVDTAGFYALVFITFFLLVIITGDSFFVDNLLWQYSISFSLYFLYFFGFESWLGKTPGKLVTRTHVVAANGAKPSASQIAGRSVSRLVPFDAFSFFGDPPLGWHDEWSRTMVVNDRPKTI